MWRMSTFCLSGPFNVLVNVLIFSLHCANNLASNNGKDKTINTPSVCLMFSSGFIFAPLPSSMPKSRLYLKSDFQIRATGKPTS